MPRMSAVLVPSLYGLCVLLLAALGLVVACRRIVERHPTSGPLWWFCASLLTASDPFRAAAALARRRLGRLLQ